MLAHLRLTVVHLVLPLTASRVWSLPLDAIQLCYMRVMYSVKHVIELLMQTSSREGHQMRRLTLRVRRRRSIQFSG